MSRWPSVLWRITLPLIARAILFAAVLVFLLTLGEVGVPTFLRCPVYPHQILTQFAAFYDFSAATAAANPDADRHSDDFGAGNSLAAHLCLGAQRGNDWQA